MKQSCYPQNGREIEKHAGHGNKEDGGTKTANRTQNFGH